jgi:ATP-binding protein involved in chromosome partitioning
VALQDGRKAIEMFRQVNVDVLGIVENMSFFTCPHCHHEIDIFSKGGVERTAREYQIAFLGSVALDPEIRYGGDRGLPISLAGELSEQAAPFYKVARQLAERAQEHASKETNILEIR